MLERRVFDLVVVRKLDHPQRYTPAMRRAIEHAYYVAERIGESYVIDASTPGRGDTSRCAAARGGKRMIHNPSRPFPDLITGALLALVAISRLAS